MNNLYEGPVDERQSTEPIVPSRFRPRYRALSPEEVKLHDEIKDAASLLESLYDKILMPGQYKSLAMTSLEESVMWAVKELTK